MAVCLRIEGAKAEESVLKSDHSLYIHHEILRLIDVLQYPLLMYLSDFEENNNVFLK
jgi:hypothetical protein